jgi:hypothetical protein
MLQDSHKEFSVQGCIKGIQEISELRGNLLPTPGEADAFPGNISLENEMRDQKKLYFSNFGRRVLKNLNAKRRRLLVKGLPTSSVDEKILVLKQAIATCSAGHKKLLEWLENGGATKS